MDPPEPIAHILLLPPELLQHIWEAADANSRRALYGSCRALRAVLGPFIARCIVDVAALHGKLPQHARLAQVHVVQRQQGPYISHTVETLVKRLLEGGESLTTTTFLELQASPDLLG